MQMVEVKKQYAIKIANQINNASFVNVISNYVYGCKQLLILPEGTLLQTNIVFI